MDKEAVVHIHNGILLSHKKNTFVSSDEVDKPRILFYSMKRVKKEINILYSNVHTWNLEKWY